MYACASSADAPSEWISGWNKTPTLATSPIADVLPVEFDAIKFPTESPGRPSPFRPISSPLSRDARSS